MKDWNHLNLSCAEARGRGGGRGGERVTISDLQISLLILRKFKRIY